MFVLLVLGLVLVFSAIAVWFLLPSRYVAEAKTKRNRFGKRPTVQILVLGDIGRSPRMQYHAMSIAKHGGRVDLIGYDVSDVHPEVSKNPLIEIVPIPTTPSYFQTKTTNKLLFFIPAIQKVLWQTLSLCYVLGYETEASQWMLVQNPPSIPTLAIANMVCYLRNTKLVVDWHNFGYSILALKLGNKHPLVVISKLVETMSARSAIHLTVTNAMGKVLKDSFGHTAYPLHDRPSEIFQPLSKHDRFEFLARCPETKAYHDQIRQGKCKLLVSSTSWTADEDFAILLDALVQYSSQASEGRLPRLLVIITGKGPQKEFYLSRIESLRQDKSLEFVDINTAWLSMTDYALLLGSADLGVSLHTSSSGVDLPMKVVDMFGTGLPVVGCSFEAWIELVVEEVNGRGFKSVGELAEHLVELFGDEAKLQRLRRGAMQECARRWDQEWDPVAGRILGLVS